MQKPCRILQLILLKWENFKTINLPNSCPLRVTQIIFSKVSTDIRYLDFSGIYSTALVKFPAIETIKMRTAWTVLEEFEKVNVFSSIQCAFSTWKYLKGLNMYYDAINSF